MSFFSLLLIFFFFFFLSFVFSCINKMSKFDYLFSTSFECGFTSFFMSHLFFSVHYFFVAIIFLFLDLELCCLFPIFLLDFMDWKVFICFFIFGLTILLALLMEWSVGSLDWKF